MFNTNMKKLHEKSRSAFPASEKSEMESVKSVQYPAFLSQAPSTKHRSPPNIFTDAAVSMMVDCVSP
jgi:hypothetical protein